MINLDTYFLGKEFSTERNPILTHSNYTGYFFHPIEENIWVTFNGFEPTNYEYKASFKTINGELTITTEAFNGKLNDYIVEMLPDRLILNNNLILYCINKQQ